MNYETITIFFNKYGVIIEGIAAIIGIIGGICGAAGWVISKILKKEVKKKIKDFEVTINEIKTKNAQIAKTINNYGLSYKDTKDIANEVFDDKSKNIPEFYIQENEPTEIKNGSIWIGGKVELDFGNEDDEDSRNKNT